MNSRLNGTTIESTNALPMNVAELEESINTWLINYLADVFNLPVDEVDTAMAFERFGLDSSSAVGLSGDVGSWIGCSIDPMIAYNHPSIDELSKALANNLEVQTAVKNKGLAA